MEDLFEHPTGDLSKEVQKSFNEDPGTSAQSLEIIKEWLRKEPHLPDVFDDGRIMTFLRGCNFSLEKCKRKLDMYFTMRNAVPEFFEGRDVDRPEIQELLKLAKFAVLPKLTPNGSRITVAFGPSEDFETPDIANMFKVLFMTADLRLGMEKHGVFGDIYLLDGSVAILKHFIKVSPVVAKKFFVCVQEAYPVKIKEVHVVNPTSLIDFIIKWVSPFLKEKIRKRIFVHSTLESLHRAIPKDCLPDEYGGTAGATGDYMDLWMEAARRNKEWFKEQENIKSDESKRQGKPTSFEDLFGLDGSFKQLIID